jgi:hypothetical protein
MATRSWSTPKPRIPPETFSRNYPGLVPQEIAGEVPDKAAHVDARG